MSRNTFALSCILLSCCCSGAYADFDASNGCPGVQIDNRYYVTDKAALKGCTYSIDGHYPFPPTVNKLADYTCIDRDLNQFCTGYLINPNYVFWDNEKQRYIDPPACPKNITSCYELDDVCQAGGDRECVWNHYICQSKDLSKAIKVNGTTVKVTVWCYGAIVDAPPQYNCPPTTVASLDDVTRYCGDNGYVVNHTKYLCKVDDKVVCEGTIDSSLLPLCTRQATDCSPGARSRVCALQLHPAHEEFCGAYFSNNSDGTSTFEDNRLMCADRLDSSTWCMSILSPEDTSRLVADETCPTSPLNSCADLQTAFYYPEYCRCVTQENTTTFECYTDGNEKPWCAGTIQPQSEVRTTFTKRVRSFYTSFERLFSYR